MRKIVILGTALAVLATVSSCSSDDDLTQSSKTAVQGTPVKIVLGNVTRADLSKTTTENLSSFQLYGIQQTASKNLWMNNVQFTQNGGSWSSAANPTWPVDNKETLTNFYGFSDGVTNGIPEGLTPSIENDAQSFTFTFGEGSENTRYYSQFTQTQIDNATVPAMKTAWQTQRNSKTTTATVLDSDRQTDLLVTADNTTGVEGTDGTLNLAFKHSLASLVIKAMFVGDEAVNKWPSTSVFYIEWIRIYGLYTSGTYTFGSGWTNSDSDSKVVYEKFFGEEDSATPDPRWTMSIVPYATYNVADDDGKKATYQTIVDAGEFMAIPQDYSSRAYAGQGTAISVAQGAGQCYIELCGYFKLNSTAGATGQGQLLYFPLNVKNNVIAAGKQHTILLDLTSALKSDGSYLATPSQAGGN